MGRGSGSISQAMALVAAICLLWVYPLCLFHEVSAASSSRVITSDLDHGSSPPAVCDAHLFYAAVSGQETAAGAKAGVSLRIEPLRAILHERFSVISQHELAAGFLPASRSAPLASSKELYILYAVYQI